MRILRSFAAGALFGLGMLSIVSVYAAVVPLFTGPAGSNPANVPSAIADLNTLVGAINTDMAPATSIGFAANGSVATALSSVGPTGSHTTVQEWITITDASGVVRYVPGF